MSVFLWGWTQRREGLCIHSRETETVECRAHEVSISVGSLVCSDWVCCCFCRLGSPGWLGTHCEAKLNTWPPCLHLLSARLIYMPHTPQSICFLVLIIVLLYRLFTWGNCMKQKSTSQTWLKLKTVIMFSKAIRKCHNRGQSSTWRIHETMPLAPRDHPAALKTAAGTRSCLNYLIHTDWKVLCQKLPSLKAETGCLSNITYLTCKTTK